MMKLEQGQQYRAEISLGMLERMAGNEMVAAKLEEAGFTGVVVTGSGAKRIAMGTWPNDTREVKLPSQVASASPA
jgi:uncharacterized membrane protein